MGVRAETAPIVNVARLQIQLVSQPGVDAVLDLLKSSRVSHVIDARRVGKQLLAHSLCTQEGGNQIKLRNVRPYGIAGVRATEEEIWRDVTMAVSRPGVGRHSRKFVCSLSSSFVRSVIGERDIAQQRSPVQFDQFRPVSLAGD